MKYLILTGIILILLWIIKLKTKREEIYLKQIEQMERKISILERIVNLFKLSTKEQDVRDAKAKELRETRKDD
ncbi:MAG: hypothetical protein KDK36_06825 [Leptospiraceae bacterium]|nr:hypothetical protein [Leptospiraceae bacterium]